MGGFGQGFGRDLGGSWEDFTSKMEGVAHAPILSFKFHSNFDFGGFWRSFGRILGRFWEGFQKIFYVRTPALSREAPRSVPMRGGPAPLRVLDDSFINPSLVLLLEGLRPFLRRLRGGRRTFGYGPFRGHFSHFFAIFRIFSHFGRILSHHCIFY